MDFEGKNYRALGEVKRLSFGLDLSINNLEGSGAFGFNGEGYGDDEGVKKNFEFKFEHGKIIDPENRFVWSYIENQNVRLSGNVYDNDYDYHINDIPVCYIGKKDPMIVQKFHINSTGCIISADLYVNADEADYSIFMGDSFDLNGTFNISIMNNNPGLPFTIFGGTLINQYLKIINLPTQVGYQPFNIIVQPQDGLVAGTLEEKLSLETSVGVIEKEFTLTVVES